MKQKALSAALAAMAIMGTCTAAEARAAAGPKVTVNPKTVSAGNAITLGLTRTHGRTCVLTIHRDRFGAKARIKRKVVRGRTLIGIRASTRTGRWKAVVRCGKRKAAAGFRVAKRKSGTTRGKAGAPAAGPTADEQGFVAGN